MGSLFGFRLALSLIYAAILVLAVASGAALGYAGGQHWYNDPIGGLIAGSLIAGIVGWIVAAFATGIGQTLLSINDHLAAIRKNLEQAKAAPADKPGPRFVKERIAPVFSASRDGGTPAP